jgi:plastocyanin
MMKFSSFLAYFLQSAFLVTIICSITYGIFSETLFISYPEVWGQQTEQKQIRIVTGAYNPYNRNFYVPSVESISKGSFVTWTNYDSSFHTVTSGSYDSGPSVGTERFDSRLLLTNDFYTVKFNSTGIYDYYCTLHPFMSGRIIVS